MPTYEYSALTQGGRLMKGTVEASSPQQAGQVLAEMHLQVQSIDAVRPPPLRSRFGRAELLLFNQQLASITKAGVPLDRSLRELAGDIDKPKMRKLVLELADDLETGMGVEEAFDKRKNFFPPLYGHIVKAGVKSGRLSEMLASLNRHLEAEGATRRIIIEAITYPLVVLAIAAVLLTGIFLVVIPAFEPILRDLGQEKLPGLTLLFLELAKNVIPFWIMIGIVVVGITMASYGMSLSARGRRFKEGVYFSLPALGRLYHRGLLSRTSDALAVLVGAGCDLATAARMAFSATGSQTFLDEGESLAKQLESGQDILRAGAVCKHVPGLFFYSMQTGSQRNELQDNLYSLCDMYRQQVRVHQARLQGLLLPMMVLVVGGVIALTIMAMFLPFMGIMRSLH
jgi:type II secretory pathway component PulF